MDMTVMRYGGIVLIFLLSAAYRGEGAGLDRNANLSRALNQYGEGNYSSALYYFSKAEEEGVRADPMVKQMCLERKRLGRITPEYTQKISVLVYRRTARQEDPNSVSHEITPDRFERIVASVKIFKQMAEVLSGGKLSVEIRPRYIDTTIRRVPYNTLRPNLTRPDLESIEPVLDTTVIEEILTSDVLFVFFELDLQTNAYGGNTQGGYAAFPFPLLPGRFLTKRGICLFNTVNWADDSCFSLYLLYHEWFHTVEWMRWDGATVGPYSISHSFDQVSQDWILKENIYDTAKFPGMTIKYNVKNLDWIYWMLTRVVPETFRKWRSEGRRIGWEHFSYSTYYPMHLLEDKAN